MPLSSANQAQLIRSSQKDEYYRSVLRNSANEACQSVAGKSSQRTGIQLPLLVEGTHMLKGFGYLRNASEGSCQ